MKKVLYSLLVGLSLFSAVMPGVLFSADNTTAPTNFHIVVDCDGSHTTGANACDFVAFIKQLNKIILYAIYISFPITGIAMAYAGYLLMTAEGNTKQWDAAKEMVTRVLIGFVLILGAWILIRTIISQLVVPNGIVDLLGQKGTTLQDASK